MKKLKSKIAFITGASSGIGKSTAYKLAGIGMNLIICARRLDRIKKIAEELKRKFNVKIYAFKLDVRNYNEVRKKISALPDEWKNIEVLINNAGLSRGLNKIQNGILLDWEEMIDTNIKGLLYVTKEIIPLMLKNNSGHIVNIGSIAGHEVYPAGNVYSATKFAVDALTKSMRIDLLDTPIKVSTVDPGLVETEFSLVRFRGDSQKAESVYKGISPLTGDDVAESIEFIVTRDEHVNVAEIILFPKIQAGAMVVNRK